MSTSVKKPRYDQTWSEDYSDKHNGIVKSDKGDTYAFCKLCNCHFSIKILCQRSCW